MAQGSACCCTLTIVFSLLYGIVSYSFSYYGEMVTYLGITIPRAALALVSWLRNPFRGNRAEVAVNRIGRYEVFLMGALAAIVTVVFYFILRYFGTANLVPSTLSVTTSFLAAYLSFRRSPYYALCYAANNAVLIVLWILAVLENIQYLSMVMCFSAFLVNDLYDFFNWRKIENRQYATGQN